MKRLKAEGWIVSVQTKIGEVFNSNPNVAQMFIAAYPTEVLRRRGNTIFDLDLAYEKDPKCHIIDAYSKVVFGDTETEHRCELFSKVSLKPDILVRMPEGDFAVVHMGIGWENRTFSEGFWKEVVTNCFLPVVCIGGSGDRHPHPDWEEFDLVNKLSVHELAHVVSKAKVFIGPDSGPLHIAQTTDTPCIGLYTCAKAEYRVHGNVHPIVPQINCYGCLHDEPPPVTYCGCRRKDFKCLELITPQMVLDKIVEILK